jgi:hypothetical protein
MMGALMMGALMMGALMMGALMMGALMMGPFADRCIADRSFNWTLSHCPTKRKITRKIVSFLYLWVINTETKMRFVSFFFSVGVMTQKSAFSKGTNVDF